MIVVSRTFCDNCNGECWPRTVTIDWKGDDDVPQRKVHGLCEDCARMIASLDLAGFVQAHEERPRSLPLP